MPGQTQTQYFFLKNNSSNADLSIAAQAITPGGTISPSAVTVTFTPVELSGTPGTPVPGSVPGSHTLTEWQGIPTGLGIPNIINRGKQRYKMDVTVDSGVTTSGGTFNFNFTFTGTQVVTSPTPTTTP